MSFSRAKGIAVSSRILEAQKASVRAVRECLRLLNTLRPQPVPDMAMVAEVLASELEPTTLRRIRLALRKAGL